MKEAGLSEVVRTVAHWLKGFVLLYGIYLVIYGHLTPGGGFGGGVVIACGFVLLTLAGGAACGSSFFRREAASTLDSVGVLAFLALAWVGTWAVGGAFFRNFIASGEASWFALFSGGIIPLANLALGLKVASSLFLVFTALAALRIVTGRLRDEEREER